MCNIRRRFLQFILCLKEVWTFQRKFIITNYFDGLVVISKIPINKKNINVKQLTVPE